MDNISVYIEKMLSLSPDAWFRFSEILIIVSIAYSGYWVVKKYLTLLDDRHKNNMERLDILEKKNELMENEKSNCVAELKLVTFQLTITNERLSECMNL